MNRKIISIILIMLVIGLMAGCESSTGTSTGGASLEFGTARDDSTLELTNPGTTFKTNQDVYWVFNYNGPFGTDTISIALYNTVTNEKMLEQPYKVKTDSTLYSNTIGFTKPGKYRVEITVGGKVTAKQELNIQ